MITGTDRGFRGVAGPSSDAGTLSRTERLRRTRGTAVLSLGLALGCGGLAPARAAEPSLLVGLSTRHHEWAPAISPDGHSLCFGVSDPNFVSVTRAWTLVCADRRGESWGDLEVAPFSGIWSDAYPAFSPDGRRLYFASDRPGMGRSDERRDFDLWWVERTAVEGERVVWGPPRRVALSSEADELRPWPADRGLYFTSDRSGGAGGLDLWRAERLDDGSFGVAEPVVVANSSAGDIDPWVDADERLLVFASDRPGGLGDYDLFASRRGTGGSWSKPERLAAYSSPARDDGPSVFAGEIYFSSRRGFADSPLTRRWSAAEIRKALHSVLNGAANLYRAPLVGALASVETTPEAGCDMARPSLTGMGTVSTELFEGHPAPTPDGNELYFTVYTRNWLFNAIFVSTRGVGGIWGEARVAPFSGRFADATTAVSPDGRTLFFASRRPPSEDFDLWRVTRRGDGSWGEPEHLPAPINSPWREFAPSATADGTLYFMSRRPGGFGAGDIYRARFTPDDGWGEVENLGAAINTEHEEGNVSVDPQQTVLLLMADRPDGHGGDDIYLARRTPVGEWGPAELLPPPINGRENDFSPRLAPDGRTLFFASNRFDRATPVCSYARLVQWLDSVYNGASNIYEMDFSPWLDGNRRHGLEGASRACGVGASDAVRSPAKAQGGGERIRNPP